VSGGPPPRCIFWRETLNVPPRLFAPPPAPHAGEKLIRNWLSYNDPDLLPKFMRHAERIARELGVADEVREFDAAAAAFPNKPKVIAAT
jgi:hypothetical protein